MWNGFRNKLWRLLLWIQRSACDCAPLNKLGTCQCLNFRSRLWKFVTVILQKRISWCVNSENISNEVFFKFFQTLEERSSLARRAVRASRAAFRSHPGSQHATWSSPRSRAKFNRACACRTLASLSTMAMMFLQHGGVNPARRPASSMAWSRALRAADSASRISPSSLTATSAAAFVSSTKAVAFDQKSLMISCVSPSAGRSHNGGDTISIFVRPKIILHLFLLRSEPDVRLHFVDDGKLPTKSCGVSRPRQHAAW